MTGWARKGPSPRTPDRWSSGSDDAVLYVQPGWPVAFFFALEEGKLGSRGDQKGIFPFLFMLEKTGLQVFQSKLKLTGL